MAMIKPFRGVRYNTARFPNMQAVVSQPYDRISRQLKQRYYDLSPYNIARIIQGHLEDDHLPPPPNGGDVYDRARQYYAQWLREGVLVREQGPAFYAYEQRFCLGGQPYARLGLIAAVELADYHQGIILPHERTHSGPKVDRLRLMNTLQINPEQVFLLYPDPENRVNTLLRQAIEGRAPDIDTVEVHESAVQQRVWVLTDPALLRAVQDEMAARHPLIIADGHHRYETALAYRDEQRRAHPDAPPTAAFNYVGATLVSMDDPGLVILPTHREIRNFDAVCPATVLERARQHFTVAPVADLRACLSAVNAHSRGHAFGFYGGREVGFHVLTLRDEQLPCSLIEGAHSRVWKSLAVTIVHKILLEQIAGVPPQGIEDKSMVRYHRDPQAPVESIDRGEGNFVFFLSPTRIEEIRACALNREPMPQKSTDFYPKMISGLALMPIGEEVLT